MPSPKPEGWKQKREARITLTSCCYAAVYCNTHKCPICGGLTQAGKDAEFRKANK